MLAHSPPPPVSLTASAVPSPSRSTLRERPRARHFGRVAGARPDRRGAARRCVSACSTLCCCGRTAAGEHEERSHSRHRHTLHVDRTQRNHESVPAWRHGRPQDVRFPPRVDRVSTTKSRRPGPSVRTRVAEFRDGDRLDHEDRVATEEPLEIRVAAPGSPAQRVAVTMRTPGHDFELAAGWLVHEGVTTPGRGRAACATAPTTTLTELEEFNVVTVEPRHSPARAADGTAGQLGLRRVRHRLGAGRARGGRAESTPVTLDLADRARPARPAARAASRVSAGPVACTRRGCSRPTAPRSSYARTSGGTTPSTRSIGVTHPRRRRRCRRCSCSAAGSASSWSRRPWSRASPRSWPSAPRPRSRSRWREDAGLVLVGFTRPERCVVYAGADRVTAARVGVCSGGSVGRPLLAWPHAHPAHLRLAPRPVVPRRGPPRRAGGVRRPPDRDRRGRSRSTWWSSPATSTTGRCPRSTPSRWPTRRFTRLAHLRARVVVTSGNHDSARRLGLQLPAGRPRRRPPAHRCRPRRRAGAARRRARPGRRLRHPLPRARRAPPGVGPADPFAPRGAGRGDGAHPRRPRHAARRAPARWCWRTRSSRAGCPARASATSRWAASPSFRSSSSTASTTPRSATCTAAPTLTDVRPLQRVAARLLVLRGRPRQGLLAGRPRRRRSRATPRFVAAPVGRRARVARGHHRASCSPTPGLARARGLLGAGDAHRRRAARCRRWSGCARASRTPWRCGSRRAAASTAAASTEPLPAGPRTTSRSTSSPTCAGRPRPTRESDLLRDRARVLLGRSRPRGRSRRGGVSG